MQEQKVTRENFLSKLELFLISIFMKIRKIKYQFHHVFVSIYSITSSASKHESLSIHGIHHGKFSTNICSESQLNMNYYDVTKTTSKLPKISKPPSINNSINLTEESMTPSRNLKYRAESTKFVQIDLFKTQNPEALQQR